MARQARTTSATSVYHAILRGVNKQQVFEDEDDFKRFLNVLHRQSKHYFSGKVSISSLKMGD